MAISAAEPSEQETMNQRHTGPNVPRSPVRHDVQTGLDLLSQGRLGEATQLSKTLRAAAPNDAEVLFFYGEVALASGHVDAALDAITRAVEAAGGQLSLLLRKAHVLLLLRRRADARQVLLGAATVVSGNARRSWALGRALAKAEDPVAARSLYEQALSMGLREPGLLYDLAVSQFFTGDLVAAEASLDDLLTQAPQTGHAQYLRATVRRQTSNKNHIDQLQALIDAGSLNTDDKAACLYALAKELEDLNRSSRSFTALAEGARLKRSTLNYDADAERAAIDEIRATYTAETIGTLSVGHEEVGPIFIVGMPRTGTTLLDRMLGRHPDVTSAGELPDFGQELSALARQQHELHIGASLVEASLRIDFASLGKAYMTSARQMAPSTANFIDKMPVNFMYCGLIKRALPNAKIIHMVRDPMDTCYAVYKTLFNNAYPFSYDLDELSAYFITYHRLMEHWHDAMPGDILKVSYEQLVANPAQSAKDVLEWCGLTWDDRVLAPSENDTPSMTASAAQVREPIYTSSVQKWRQHEEALAPLRARLRAAGIIDY